MTTTRKQYTPNFKARVAIEAIRGEKTLSQWVRSTRCMVDQDQNAVSGKSCEQA